jgi:multiple sugar transport system ATP-binding protein
MAEVRLEHVSKVFPDGTAALRDLDLTLPDGELLVLVGPSGCGKTTALRIVAGLDHPSAGTISIGGRVVNKLSEAERDIAMVFQNYALYPHMSVYNNIAFPLKLAHMRRAERDERVQRVAAILGLTDHLRRKPAQLSGGQRQRVAMGRAIVREPQLFLMDEPLSNLDAKLRVQMRADILDLQRQIGVTTMYVTHDQAEAMTLGDRVAVLRKGELQQIGPPEAVYDGPDNVFVANFLGSPPMNLVAGRVVAGTRSGVAVAVGEQTVSLDQAELDRYPELERRPGADVVLGMRPEGLVLAGLEDDPRRLRATVTVRESLGSDVYVRLRLPGAGRLPRALRLLAFDADEVDQMEETQHQTELVARLPAATRIRRQDAVALTVLPGGIRLFDVEHGRSLSLARDTASIQLRGVVEAR